MIFLDILNSCHCICAHRGFRSHRPENTISAFLASIGHCHFIEMDIQMSKDAIPMVIHDPILSRTSDAKIKRQQLGLQSLKVSNWTAPQLKKLDMGSWFITTDPFSTIQKGEVSVEEITCDLPQTIITLEELLNHPMLHNIPINIEIKDHNGTDHNHIVVQTVVDTIVKTQAKTRVLISSFNHRYLLEAKEMAADITTAALQKETNPPDLINYLKSLGVKAYHPHENLVDKDLFSQLRNAGFFINIYTVNDTLKWRKYFGLGATAIITDFPTLQY